MTALTINTRFAVLASTLMKVFTQGQYADVGVMQAVASTLPVDYDVPITSDSYQASDQARGLVLEPAGTISAMTVTMPAHPYDGQEWFITSTQTVTTLTHQASGSQTLNSALTTITATLSTHGRWVYHAGTTTWYRVS